MMVVGICHLLDGYKMLGTQSFPLRLLNSKTAR